MRKVILILGRTGCGKTTLSKSIRKKASRLITLDALNEYDGTIFYSFIPACDYILKNLNGSFNVNCRFTNDTDVEFLFKLIKLLKNVLFIVEEAEIYLSPLRMNKDFLWLIRYGRHRNISLLCVARRNPEISIDFRSQATSILTFKQIEPNDLRTLEDYGFDSDAVVNLGEHNFLHIGENINEIQFKKA